MINVIFLNGCMLYQHYPSLENRCTFHSIRNHKLFPEYYTSVPLYYIRFMIASPLTAFTQLNNSTLHR